MVHDSTTRQGKSDAVPGRTEADALGTLPAQEALAGSLARGIPESAVNSWGSSVMVVKLDIRGVFINEDHGSTDAIGDDTAEESAALASGVVGVHASRAAWWCRDLALCLGCYWCNQQQGRGDEE